MKNASSLVGDRRQRRNKNVVLRHAVEHHIIYLACPYSDPDMSVRERRFRAATKAAATLVMQGHIIYSPITMTHPIDVVLGSGVSSLGSDYWVSFDEAFMDFCSEMVILDIQGWDKSRGIKREIEYFRVNGKPIRLMGTDGSLYPIDSERDKGDQ